MKKSLGSCRAALGRNSPHPICPEMQATTKMAILAKFRQICQTVKSAKIMQMML